MIPPIKPPIAFLLKEVATSSQSQEELVASIINAVYQSFAHSINQLPESARKTIIATLAVQECFKMLLRSGRIRVMAIPLSMPIFTQLRCSHSRSADDQAPSCSERVSPLSTTNPLIPPMMMRLTRGSITDTSMLRPRETRPFDLINAVYQHFARIVSEIPQPARAVVIGLLFRQACLNLLSRASITITLPRY